MLADLSHEPTLAKLNQEPTLAKINQVKLLCETESYITNSSSIGYTQQHIGAAHRFSVFHSSLVIFPSSRMILDKLKIEVTKDPIDPVGKNGEHFIKSNQHMDILHAFINYVRATSNHGLSPSGVDLGDPKGELTEMLKYTSNGCMLMKVDWGGNLKLIHTSCGCMLMK